MQQNVWAFGYAVLGVQLRVRAVYDTEKILSDNCFSKWTREKSHDIAADTLLVNGKRFHGCLHPVETG